MAPARTSLCRFGRDSSCTPRFTSPGSRVRPHPFTIASAPGDDSLRFAVKRFGDFTSSLMSLRPGSASTAGRTLRAASTRESNPAHPQTWIAGGIGITPFLSWARSLDRSILADLYYCMPGPEQAHFLDELYDIADRYPAFRVIPMRKRSLGHLTVAISRRSIPTSAQGHVFICGPPVMIDNLTMGLATRGVPPHRIHSEAFDFR